MGALPRTVEITMLSYYLWRKTTHEIAIPLTRTREKCSRKHVWIPKTIHHVGYHFGRARGSREVAWRPIHPYLKENIVFTHENNKWGKQ